MSEVAPQVNLQQDNPFSIGKRPMDTFASFTTLIKTLRIIFSKAVDF